MVKKTPWREHDPLLSSPINGREKMRISDVMRETGLSRTTVTLLYKATTLKVDLEALDKLCDLFNCPLSDILEKMPSDSQS